MNFYTLHIIGDFEWVRRSVARSYHYDALPICIKHDSVSTEIQTHDSNIYLGISGNQKPQMNLYVIDYSTFSRCQLDISDTVLSACILYNIPYDTTEFSSLTNWWYQMAMNHNFIYLFRECDDSQMIDVMTQLMEWIHMESLFPPKHVTTESSDENPFEILMHQIKENEPVSEYWTEYNYLLSEEELYTMCRLSIQTNALDWFQAICKSFPVNKKWIRKWIKSDAEDKTLFYTELENL